MSGLVDAAAAMMRMSSQRIDNAALNIANVSTPGYKRQVRPSATADAVFNATLEKMRVDLRGGKLSETARPLDVAINGDGFFQMRAGERIVYSRQGAFHADGEGHLVGPQGYVLQQRGGGDLIVGGSAVTVTSDGNVLDGERAIGRIAVMRARDTAAVEAIDGGTFAIADDAVEAIDAPSLRPGALEASNVSLGDEMVGMMGAMRGAETGARLIQLYDDLMGKAISSLGQAAR